VGWSSGCAAGTPARLQVGIPTRTEGRRPTICDAKVAWVAAPAGGLGQGRQVRIGSRLGCANYLFFSFLSIGIGLNTFRENKSNNLDFF
jgi:hypothetical protein